MKEQKNTAASLDPFVGFVISAAVAGISIFSCSRNRRKIWIASSLHIPRVTENFINAVFHKTDVLAAVEV